MVRMNNESQIQAIKGKPVEVGFCLPQSKLADRSLARIRLGE